MTNQAFVSFFSTLTTEQLTAVREGYYQALYGLRPTLQHGTVDREIGLEQLQAIETVWCQRAGVQP